MLAKMWRKGALVYFVGNISWYSPYGEEDGGFSKNKNTSVRYFLLHHSTTTYPLLLHGGSILKVYFN